ncbi:type VII secretion protein EccB [Actinoplanes palleronii]|uniref:Type VII secretion protein EccB n=1 Tax=Actinoplanes awajinensis subsp. mycoplanecinus TaxID=135947 RepID=A0A117MPW5_9ACTN|nr:MULTISPECIES: type VII secretion protein EccB [Actinoplanes]KUL29306.1 hypothetical protein ADL15_28810 [Actinoplanes awajinensis subsp. mycoplanecinus]
MRTRREQVQAYRFVTRRIVSAMLSGEPESNELPMRRLGMALFASAMVGAIVLAGLGVYGLVTGKQSGLSDQALVIEKETGAKYVYLNGKLYPALNYTSARLVLDSEAPDVRTMSQKSLQGLPRGLPVGIAGAPDALPAAGNLLGLPWQVCQAASETTAGGSVSRAVIGRELPGAAPLGERGLLVSSGDATYLVWHNTRLRIASTAVMAALGLTSATPVEVDEPLINAIAAGPDLEPLALPGKGLPSSKPIGGASALVGDLFQSAGQYYVLTRTGLVTIGEVSARLALAGGGSPRQITPDQVGGALVRESVEPAGMPPAMPALNNLPAPVAVCVADRDTAGRMPLTTTVEVFKTLPPDLQTATADAVAGQQGARDQVQTVDQVVMTGGRAAVVRAIAGSGESSGTAVYLVAGGVRYPFGERNGDARKALGYGGVTPTPVPAAMLTLVPTGPTLDIAAAKAFATTQAAPAASTGS